MDQIPWLMKSWKMPGPAHLIENKYVTCGESFEKNVKDTLVNETNISGWLKCLASERVI